MCRTTYKRDAVAATLEEIQHVRHGIAHGIGVGTSEDQRHRIGCVLRNDERSGITCSAEAAAGTVHLTGKSFAEHRSRSAAFLILDRRPRVCWQNRGTR